MPCRQDDCVDIFADAELLTDDTRLKNGYGSHLARVEGYIVNYPAFTHRLETSTLE